MKRGILLGLGLAMLLHRLGKVLAVVWRPYFRQPIKAPPDVVYWGNR